MIIALPMNERKTGPLENLPLAADGDTAERLIAEVGTRLAEFLRTLEEQPAQNGEHYDASHPLWAASLPSSPSPVDATLDTLFDDVIPAAFNCASPAYLAYIPGGGLMTAAIGELIAGTVNRYTGLWVSAPGPVALEMQALRWLCELLRQPEGTSALLTSGASTSTLIAFVAAREKLLGEDISRGTAYYSSEAHHSVAKAARIAGIPTSRLRSIPPDASFRLDPAALRSAVEEDRAAGFRPFLVCASAGTVNTGAVDPLAAISEICRDEELWLHVDGAYGGAFLALEELAATFRGIEHADSIAMDPHKGLFLAYGTGALLVRDLADLRRAFSATGSYMPGYQEGVERLDFCELTPELSREWRGLRLWLPLKIHGADAFRSALREKRGLALYAAEEVAKIKNVELAAPPELSLFAFRQRLPGASLAEENRHNHAVLAAVNDARRVMLTGTEVDGIFWLRICVLHVRTHRERLDEALELLRAQFEPDGRPDDETRRRPR